MIKVLIFTDSIPYKDLANMNERELFALARANEHLSTNNVKIVGMKEFQTMYNLNDIDANNTTIFFIDVEQFEVEVLECNSEVFEDNYCAFIDDENDDAFFNKRYTLVAPLCVKEEIEDLTEECINII